MFSVALQQVSSPFARENAERTLHKPVGIRFVEKYLPAEAVESLKDQCANNGVYIWGAKPERTHQTWRVLEREALVLFRRGPTVYKRGIVIETVRSKALAELLWGTDSDGETWSTIMFFSKITDMNRPAAKLNESLGRSAQDNWQGLVVLAMKESEAVRSFFARELG